MNNYLRLYTVLSALLLLGSCATKKVVVVKNMIPDSVYTAHENKELLIQNGDRVTILVSAKSVELAAPFNNALGAYAITNDGEVRGGSEQAQIGRDRGYLVGRDGAIEFPVLGYIPAAGLTLTQLKEKVKDLLVSNKYIKDPIVKVELINLKINMMGEVNAVGIIDAAEEKITLLEAISRAGGLTHNAAPDKVTVIREENGQRKLMLNNIESTEIFNSPSYYLQQNDIVYVQPRDGVPTQKEESTWRIVGIGMSFISVIISTLTLIAK